MGSSPETGKISEEQRIALVKQKKRQTQMMYITLSILGVLGFLLIWEFVSDAGVVNSRYLASPSTILKLFVTKLTDPKPDGAVLGVGIEQRGNGRSPGGDGMAHALVVQVFHPKGQDKLQGNDNK